MNQDDLRSYVVLSESVLVISELQVATLKMFSKRFDILESILRLHAKLDLLSEKGAPEAIELRSEIVSIENQYESESAQLRLSLQDALAHAETGHERHEAAVKHLKSLLGGGDTLQGPK
jgi:low affinity Fe/Cu permease